MKKTVDPEKVILTFLRNEYVLINVNATNLKFVNKKGMFGNWLIERQTSFRPFHTKDIDPILKAAPNVMSQNIHQLLLEHFMLLNPGDNVTCLIRSDHSFLTSPGLKKQLAIEALHPVQHKKDVFFPFLFQVRTNPTRYNITTKREIEIRRLCKGTGAGSGGGISGTLVNGVTKEFEFEQLLENPLHIMVLLNKHKYVNLAKNVMGRFRNHRLTLYIFMMLMRMRNPSNFKWWGGLCNAGASCYGGGGFSQTATYFGISLHQSSMIRILRNKMSFADVMVKTMKTLKLSGRFGVAIFDNTQVFTSQKHQRYGKSSKSTLATNRLFVETTIPEWFVSLIPFPCNGISLWRSEYEDCLMWRQYLDFLMQNLYACFRHFI